MASVEVIRESVSPRGQVSLRGQIFLINDERIHTYRAGRLKRQDIDVKHQR